MKNIHLIQTDKPTGLFESKSGVLHYSIMNKVRTGLLAGYHIYITSDEEIKEDDWGLYGEESVMQVKSSYDNDMSGEDIWLADSLNGCAANKDDCKKIILTTDPDLIADGVQEIDGDFLEQFVQNPTCEEVDILKLPSINGWSYIIMKRVLPLDNEDFREEPKCTCKEHDPYCCQVHGTCPTCVKQEEPKPIHEQIIEHCGGEEKFKEIAGLKPKQETLEEAAWRYNPLKKLDGEFIRQAFKEGASWQAKQDKNKYSKEEMLEFAEYCLNNVDAFTNPESLLKQFKKKNYE